MRTVARRSFHRIEALPAPLGNTALGDAHVEDDGTALGDTQVENDGTATLKPWQNPELDEWQWTVDYATRNTRHVPLEWTVDHEIPYVFSTYRDKIDFAGVIPGLYPTGHPGIPPPHPVYRRATMSFDHFLASSYEQNNPASIQIEDVLSLSELVYSLAPCPSSSGPNPQSIVLGPKAVYEEKHDVCNYEVSIAMLARFVLQGSPEIVSVFPVVLSNVEVLKRRAEVPWGLYIRLRDGSETIIPVLLRVFGSRPYIAQNLLRQSGALSVPTWQPIVDKFSNSPALMYSDVDRFGSSVFNSRWEHFTSTSNLAQHFLTNVVQMEIKDSADIQPFARIKLDAIEVITRPQFTALQLRGEGELQLRGEGDEEPELHDEDDEYEDDEHGDSHVINYVDIRRNARNVNHRTTCSFSINCILPPTQNSGCCLYHHRLIAYMVTSMPTSKQQKQAVRNAGWDSNASFVRPDSLKTMASVKLYRSLFPGKNLTFHMPDQDTLANYRTYQLFIEQTKS
ncbi:hypothetical protein OPT61_g9233 [Boeremia exigua]|uniref:Uncharacterized protein n=1 Tax=Boeremia exigua TaxID=749465 RepID=A0ACC2HVA6_9PLEO|nr:hypothetical protein OPT61_g9233 [Boeremia exigua]